jgi:hypothetical protein
VDHSAPVVGGLYGARDSDGSFRVVKVLVMDEAAVHIRMYAERFAELPTKISSSELSLGSINNQGSFGIGHAPVSRTGFLHEGRTLLATEPVRDDELEGYRIWAGEEDT